MYFDLARAEVKGCWGRRSLATKSFSGEDFGADIFRCVREKLSALGYIEVEPGHHQSQKFIAELPPVEWGRQTCFRLLPRFCEVAATFGISLDNLKEHFAPRDSAPPAEDQLLELRQIGERISLSIDYDNESAVRFLQDMKEMNTFLRAAEIRGIAFRGLRRLFSGDMRSHGRFYSLNGGDAYENMPETERLLTITIRGEAVAEIDIAASHLSILYGLRAEAFDPTSDPYLIEDIDRDVVKWWVTRALGSGDINKGRWSSRNIIDYKKKTGKTLGKDFPISTVTEAVLKSHPILNDLSTYSISPYRLMFAESEILRSAIWFLRSRNIPALPMHDGLIVPISGIEESKYILSQAFTGIFGQALADGLRLTPRLKVSKAAEDGEGIVSVYS